MPSTGQPPTQPPGFAGVSGWLPNPLLEWGQLAASVAPGKAATRARLRTLRDNGHISDGLKVYQRGRTGVSGASSYFSVLSLWAERARAGGRDDDARALTASASALEHEFAAQLTEYLSAHAYARLPETDFFWTLADKTVKILFELDTWKDSVIAVAAVTEVDAHFAHLQGRSLTGQPRSVDLPRRLIDDNGLKRGSCVFVLSRTLGSGAFVELDAAIPPRAERETAMATVAMDQAAEDLGLRDYNEGPGAPLTSEQAARAWAAARTAGLTPAPLRPAG